MTTNDNPEAIMAATIVGANAGPGFAGTGLEWLMLAHREARAAQVVGAVGGGMAAQIGNGAIAQQGNAAIAPPGNAAIVQAGNAAIAQAGNAAIGQIMNARPIRGGEMPEIPVPRAPLVDINQIPIIVRDRLGTLIGRLSGDQWRQARDELREVTQLNPVNGDYVAMQIHQALQQPDSALRRQVDGWIRDLDSTTWATRQSAQNRLEALGPGAISYIMARNPATHNHPAFDNYQPPNGQAFNPLESHHRLQRIASAQSEQGRESGVTLNLALRPIINTAVEAGIRELPEQMRNNPELQQRFRNLVQQVFSGGTGENIGTLLQGLDRQTLQAFSQGLQAAFRSHQSTRGLQVALSGDSLVISTAAVGHPGAHMSINTRTGDVRILNTFENQVVRNLVAPGDEPAAPPRTVRDFLTDIRDSVVVRLPGVMAPGHVTRAEFERQQWAEMMNNMQNNRGVPAVPGIQRPAPQQAPAQRVPAPARPQAAPGG